MISTAITGLWVPPIVASGVAQMALDEALLTWVQGQPERPMIIGRVYVWNEPTLSVGTHQRGNALNHALQTYGNHPNLQLVRRPTGGRGILHGQDISFAFVTNVPAILRLKLEDSYCIFATWVREALESLNIPLQTVCDAGSRDYLRSPLCFETATPSDLLDSQGQKVAGAAQLRRQGVLLQHGAAFLERFNISMSLLNDALQTQMAAQSDGPIQILIPEAIPKLNVLWQRLQRAYEAEALILANCDTISGSHLVPASDCSTLSAS